VARIVFSLNKSQHVRVPPCAVILNLFPNNSSMHEIKKLAKYLALRLCRMTVINDVSQLLPRIMCVLAKLLELIQLNRKFAIQPLVSAVEREIFFKQTTVLRHSRNRNGYSQRVIRHSGTTSKRRPNSEVAEYSLVKMMDTRHLYYFPWTNV